MKKYELSSFIFFLLVTEVVKNAMEYSRIRALVDDMTAALMHFH